MWSASHKDPAITLSETGNVRATKTSGLGYYVGARSATAVVGKQYWEVTRIHAGSSNMSVGIAYGTWTYRGGSGYIGGGGTISQNTNYRVACDQTSGNMWVGSAESGLWVGGGNPETGDAPSLTFTPGATVYPAFIFGDPTSQSVRAVDSPGWCPEGFKAFAEVPSVTGLVTGPDGMPAARTVRGYSRATGALLAQGVSSALSGRYTLNFPVGTEEVQIVALDDSDGDLLNDLLIRCIPL